MKDLRGNHAILRDNLLFVPLNEFNMSKKAFQMILIWCCALGAITGFGQQVNDPGVQSSGQLESCKLVLAKAQKALQLKANDECRTLIQCVSCEDPQTKQKTCVKVVAQPQRSKCGQAVEVVPLEQGSATSGFQNGFEVEIVQWPCYERGVSLEAVVVGNGEESVDGKAQASAYSFLWEIDGGKGGHGSILSCIQGSKATVRVTKLSTGVSVIRSVKLRGIKKVDPKPVAPSDDLVAVYRKTSCENRCAAFEAKIFKDGTAVWKGISNVATVGEQKGKVSVDAINSLLAEAKKKNFYRLNNRYPDYPVLDGSITTLYLKEGAEAKQVEAAESAPAEFTQLVQKFEEILAKMGWKTALAADKPGMNRQ